MMMELNGSCICLILPVASDGLNLKLFGNTYSVGIIKCKLLFQDPLVKM